MPTFTLGQVPPGQIFGFHRDELHEFGREERRQWEGPIIALGSRLVVAYHGSTFRTFPSEMEVDVPPSDPARAHRAPARPAEQHAQAARAPGRTAA